MRKIKTIKDWKYVPTREKVFSIIVLLGLIISLTVVDWKNVEWDKGTKSGLLTTVGLDDVTSVKIVLCFFLLLIIISLIMIRLKKATAQKMAYYSFLVLMGIIILLLIVNFLKK